MTALSMNCRVCGARTVEEVLDLGDQPHCNSLLSEDDLRRTEPSYPLRLGFCTTCTTSQIDYTVPKETMFSEYLYVSGTTSSLRAHFRASAERLIAALDLRAGDLVVDIGSNDGTWLSQFQDLGLHGLGVEPARNIAAAAERGGVRTLNRFFDRSVAAEIRADHGAPKLVTAAGVFFHLEELHSATAGVAALCEGGASFCVQAVYLGGMVEHNAFDQIYHEHLTYWTLTSFERLLEQYGLEVNSVQVVPIHGGSLEMLVSSRGSRPVDPPVNVLRERERTDGLTEIDTYHAFGERVWQIRDSLLALLGERDSRGDVVYAFGAPAKGATLLNSFGITTDLVRAAVERNPLKIGKYIPGARIPIMQEGSIPDPDAYLMLPWNFLDEFVARRAPYLEAGGEFIVPIPEPHVITGRQAPATAPAP
jgi:hypothetical protein